ncbi:ATP-binding protein [Parvularcula dongshanensis]|uniref:Sensory/regulatory protein RpfC n=1 Tax=Parvularcula dongshanensis TaxID=1173995 RepID=A0A840I454_9PROT|nr:ATP-binding protein [Parvularcula dongshanensis]MBB4659112.1 signal transduction histidine kinase/ActR/RegA family two-component response regulator [Parvularcula dongshanensis]
MPQTEERLREALRSLQRKHEKALSHLHDADLVQAVNARTLSATTETETFDAMFSGFEEADVASVFEYADTAWVCRASSRSSWVGLGLDDNQALKRVLSGQTVVLPDLHRVWTADTVGMPEGWHGYRGAALLPFPVQNRRKIVVLLSRHFARWQVSETERLVRLTGAAATGMAHLQRLAAERELQEAENERRVALEASAAKSAFLANISHEIRTPMNGVLAMAELLLEETLDEQQRRYAQTIFTSGEALLTVINDVLDFSKIEAGHIDLADAPFDPRTVTEDVVLLLRSTADRKGLSLDFACCDAVPTIFGDAGRFRQVLMNVVGNAIKFTERGSVTVTLACQKNDAQLAWSVAVDDTGIGIAEDKIETIFEEFSQADGAMTRRFEGTGLGLAISRRLVSLMGGTLSVTSELGRGSTFKLDLFSVCADPDEALQPAGSVTSRNGDSATRSFLDANEPRISRVLVVDDNAVNRMVVEQFLKADGYQLVMANDGEAAVEAFEQDRFDVILMDLSMPKLDGYEATALIRSIEKRKGLDRTPVLCLTAHASAEQEAICRERDMDGYLSKPIRRDALLLMVERLLHGCPRNGPADLKVGGETANC